MDIQAHEDIFDGRRSIEIEILPDKPKLGVSYDSLALTDEVFDRLDEALPTGAMECKVIIALLSEVKLERKLTRDGVGIQTPVGLRTLPIRALDLNWHATLADSRPKASTPISDAGRGGLS